MSKDIEINITNIYFKKAINKKIDDKDPEIIAWERIDNDGFDYQLMHSFPSVGDNIKKKKFFAVKDYERALFFNKGQLVGVLKGGIYKIEKKARVKGTQIVWIDSSLIEIPWGIPQSAGIPTKDGYMVGLFGDLKLKITDVKTFYNDIIAGKTEWRVQDLKLWIITLLHTSLRDIFKKYEAKRILLEERERVLNLIISNVTEEFLRYGLELETINIIGVKAPEGIDNLYNQAKIKTEILSESKTFNIENLLREKKDCEERIKNLKRKLKQQQDLLLEDRITQEKYEVKKKKIQSFIEETEQEILKLEEKINN